jgi:hypothetical protein
MEDEMPEEFNEDVEALEQEEVLEEQPEVQKNNQLDPLVEERERRQYVENEVKFLRQEIERLRQAQQPAVKDETDVYDDDDIPSIKDVKKLLEKSVGKIKQESLAEKRERQVAEAKDEYQDFDEIIKLADQLIDPEMFQVIMASSNPAKFAYRIGLTHPDAQKIKNNGAKTEKIKSNLSTPRGISEMSGTSEKGQPKSWLNVSKEEFEREKQRVLYG